MDGTVEDLDLLVDIRSTAEQIAPFLDMSPAMCRLYTFSACLGDLEAGSMLDVDMSELAWQQAMDRLGLWIPFCGGRHLEAIEKTRIYLEMIRERWKGVL